MRILVVDDEEAYLKLLGDLLKQQGCKVFLAGDGKQAREVLNQQEVDVIISDVHMPTLDGVRFHSYVREFTEARETPFIFISGMDDVQSDSVILDPHLDYFISKRDPIHAIVSLVGKLKTKINADRERQTSPE
jgi:DNA-binding response OmpR family regulator